MSHWILGKVRKALWCKHTSAECQLAGHYHGNKTGENGPFRILHRQTDKHLNSEIICAVLLFLTHVHPSLWQINLQPTQPFEVMPVLTPTRNWSKPPHFLYSIYCSHYSRSPPSLLLTFSCLHFLLFSSLFHLALISSSFSQSSSYSLICTQAWCTRVQASQREGETDR